MGKEIERRRVERRKKKEKKGTKKEVSQKWKQDREDRKVKRVSGGSERDKERS